eukprot:7854320-Lingulodinium_polyedra.AAC.1
MPCCCGLVGRLCRVWGQRGLSHVAPPDVAGPGCPREGVRRPAQRDQPGVGGEPELSLGLR